MSSSELPDPTDRELELVQAILSFSFSFSIILAAVVPQKTRVGWSVVFDRDNCMSEE